ncbi:uncharacterized protein LOC129749919 [Uranotaenia lowii]|uniref:uncharacterized protein LOC129749919 n=1 Tax=Uranotaenia lowii TaxID=190385 RepID=UPI0024785A08|nr:uncharacterized protein LOC129749919 [Uranotaenia lowii]
MNKILRWFACFSTKRTKFLKKSQPKEKKSCLQLNDLKLPQSKSVFYDVQETILKAEIYKSNDYEDISSEEVSITSDVQTTSLLSRVTSGMSPVRDLPQKRIKLKPLLETVEHYQFKENELLKPRGYHCVQNRPRICLCTCVRKTTMPACDMSQYQRLPWDASWVFTEEDSKERLKAIHNSELRLKEILGLS